LPTFNVLLLVKHEALTAVFKRAVSQNGKNQEKYQNFDMRYLYLQH
jgi:hypothetical protein